MGSSGSRIRFSDLISQFESISSDQSEWFSQMFDVHLSVEDVFEIMSPEWIRGVRDANPSKLVLLMRKCSETIYKAYDSSMDCPLSAGPECRAILNSIRIISRIAPFITEETKEGSFNSMLWSSKVIPTSIENAKPDSVGFTLLGALMRCGFIRGFSIPKDCNQPQSPIDPNRVDPEIVWGRNGGLAGVPSNRPRFQSVGREMVEIRIEIIRMALVLLCGPLYQSMGEYKIGIPVFNALLSSGDFLHTANFFVSLILSVLDYDPSHYSIPLLNSVDPISEERLASSALTLINVLVDPPSRGEDINVFREILSGGFSEKDEASTLVRCMKSKVVTLASSRKKNGIVLFLFNLLTLSNRETTVEEIRIQWGSELVMAMLSLLAVHVADQAEVGLVHTVSFVLLKLSSSREFVLDVFKRSFNRKYFTVTGSHIRDTELDDLKRISDVFFLVVLRLLPLTPDSLVELWLTILCNISPLVGGDLTNPTASTLVSVFDRMSRPSWLLRHPQRYHALAFLIETINNILQYQYESSWVLVYELILRGQKILHHIDSCSGQLHVFDEEWKEAGLLAPVRKLIEHLGPRIEEECADREDEVGFEEVCLLIKRISLVGILPVPRPIIVRQFHMTEQTRLWFTSYLYGVVFISLSAMPIIDWERVKMISLKT